MTHRVTFAAIAAALTLSACQSGVPGVDVSRQSDRPLEQGHSIPPPGAAPGTCWGMHMTPAIVETVTEQILLQPTQVTVDGTVTSPALYKTETQQRIVRERREIWFETPCDTMMDVEFVTTLQRALKARGLYHGPVTGEVNNATQRAVRRYQAEQGLDSAILSMAAARQLGLIAYDFSADE